MNEKLSYAQMLDIPLTSSVTLKPSKKRRFFRKKKVNVEEIKEAVIEKVNDDNTENSIDAPMQTDTPVEEVEDRLEGEIVMGNGEEPTSSVVTVKPKKKRKSRIIAIQLAVIGVLVAGIFLTNALIPGSGINVFLDQVFGGNEVKVDAREYTDFTPEIPTAMTNYVLEGGEILVRGESSVYSACNGVVSSVVEGEDGKFTVTIDHSEKFSTVISGLDYCYVARDGKVLKNVPVGYTKSGGAKLCFYSGDGTAIVGYVINDNTVVWAV